MLSVEDGTGKADAESYASTADADAYLSSRGKSIWSGLTDSDKEQALRRATDYMTAEYRPKWLGRRMSAVQSLDWPRYDVSLDDVGVISSSLVPKEVIKACIELAFRAASGELVDDEEARVLKETIGPIEYEYDKDVSSRKKYPLVDSILRPYTFGIVDDQGVSMIKLTRC